MREVYTKSTATKAEVFDVIENATADLLNAAGELARFPWTETSSEIIDTALGIAARVEELRHLYDDEQIQLPANVVPFVGRTA